MDQTGDHIFSVALDFGTTYSGFAYSSTSDFNKRPDKIYANEVWNAGGQGLLSRKTPTVLLLTSNKEFEAFGYEAENLYADLALDNLHKDRYYFRRYEMKLHGDERIQENTMIEDESGKPLPALLVFKFSIKYLKDKFFEILSKQGLDINNNEIIWTLTVPAIWCESAKSFMRKAAIEAGISSKQLKLALEPEAASLLCQHIPIEKTKDGISVADVGTKYMVIDLGGGTADITVHEKLPGGKLKEVHKASGGPWGGTAVDEGFIQLLVRLVGGPVITTFRKKFTADYLEMMREFEVSKRTLEPEREISFKVRVPPTLSQVCKDETDEDLGSLVNAKNSPFVGKLRVVADKLVIDRKLMIEIFEKVEHNIACHVRDILRLKDVDNVNFILLVGGFSESAMVQCFLRDKLQTKSRRVLVPQEAGLAIVKGAVIFGHQPAAIHSRIVRYTYGFNAKVPFQDGIHPERNREVSAAGKIRCKHAFKPFVEAGTSITTGEVISKTINLVSKENDSLVVYYTDATNVILTNDIRLQKLFSVKLRDILPEDAENGQPMTYQFLFGETEVESEILLPKINFSGKVSYKFKLQ